MNIETEKGKEKEKNIIKKVIYYIYILKNGKGFIKEYDYNSYDYFIFEGEYVNGKRKGKGKQYNGKGILIFDGKFLNGIKNGKGKKYDSFDGQLQFEGKYIDRIKHGKRKEYDIFGKFDSQVKYLHGKKQID